MNGARKKITPSEVIRTYQIQYVFSNMWMLAVEYSVSRL